MDEAESPRVGFVYAAVLFMILIWAWAAPLPAFAQLPPLLPPPVGSVMVTIDSPAYGATVIGTITVRGSVSFVGVLVEGVQFRLDGVNLGAEDTSPPSAISWDSTTTSNGVHILTAVARDALGIRYVSDPVRITVSNPPTPPAVTRIEETDPSITYAGNWFPADPRPWSGGTAMVSPTAGAQATLTFTGTSVNWIGFLGPQTGTARVYLDGVAVGEVDTYSPTEEVQAVVFTATSLAYTSHTLTIEVTGGSNPASTSTYIVVDAFDITP